MLLFLVQYFLLFQYPTPYTIGSSIGIVVPSPTLGRFGWWTSLVACLGIVSGWQLNLTTHPSTDLIHLLVSSCRVGRYENSREDQGDLNLQTDLGLILVQQPSCIMTMITKWILFWQAGTQKGLTVHNGSHCIIELGLEIGKGWKGELKG